MSVADQIANWGFLSLAALIVDLVFGGRRLLGRLPGTDHILFGLVAFLHGKLNRETRSDKTNAARGLLMLLVLLPVMGGIGHLVDSVAFDSRIGSVLALLMLTLTIGQRAVWDLARAIAATLGKEGRKPDENRFGAARWTLERLVLRFADGLVINLLLLMIGGFTLLLPFRLVAVTVATGSPSGLMRPRTAFHTAASWIHEILSAPGGFLAALLIAVAQFFAPRGSLRAFRGILPPKGPYILSRSMPMGALAYGMDLNFKSDTEARDDAVRWFGPHDGRARLGPADIRRCLMVAIVAALLVMLLLIIVMGGALHGSR